MEQHVNTKIDRSLLYDKALVKSWLFHLLAELEMADDVEATRTESSDGTVTLIIKMES